MLIFTIDHPSESLWVHNNDDPEILQVNQSSKSALVATTLWEKNVDLGILHVFNNKNWNLKGFQGICQLTEHLASPKQLT